MTDYSYNFGDLLGQTIAKVDATDDTVVFRLADGREGRMYHSTDCCESVRLEEVIGDWADITNSPVLIAEVATNSEIDPPQYAESFTWTFYKLATVKGHLTLRWLGQSNGYYSESVEFWLEKPPAQAGEAGTAETVKRGSVHEHAVPKGCAQ